MCHACADMFYTVNYLTEEYHDCDLYELDDGPCCGVAQ